MNAIAIIPKKPHSAHLRSVPDLTLEQKNQILIKGIRTGICGTDIEIHTGFYGEPPEGSDFLILGHESFGRVARVPQPGSKFKVGDLVVRSVRRPCLKRCLPCGKGQSDRCLTGDFSECGIKGRHGSLTEYYLEEEEYLVLLPPTLESVAVLTEPLSFVHKVTRRAKALLNADAWPPQTALVIGCGTIGILQTLVLRSMGVDVRVVARSPYGNRKSKIVEKAGAVYLSSKGNPLEKVLEPSYQAHLIVEASGNALMVPQAMKFLARSGVLCLTSITGGHSNTETSWDRINVDLVLGNKLIAGVVNSNIGDFEEARFLLEAFERLWPGLLEKMITKRVDFETFPHAFERDPDDIKVTIEIP